MAKWDREIGEEELALSEFRRWLSELVADDCPIPYQRPDRLNRDRELYFTKHVGRYHGVRRFLTEQGRVSILEGLDNNLPAWNRATPTVKMPYIALAIERLGFELLTFSLNIGPHKVAAIRYGRDAFDGALRREIAQRLKRAVGYAHFCFAVDVYTKDIGVLDPKIVHRPHLHGFIGVKPGDRPAVKKALRAAAGDWKEEGRPVDLDQPTNVCWWAYYATRTEQVAKTNFTNAFFGRSQEAARLGKAIFEREGTLEATILEISRPRKRMKITPSAEVL